MACSKMEKPARAGLFGMLIVGQRQTQEASVEEGSVMSMLTPSAQEPAPRKPRSSGSWMGPHCAPGPREPRMMNPTRLAGIPLWVK